MHEKVEVVAKSKKRLLLDTSFFFVYELGCNLLVLEVLQREEQGHR
jgi:hypothetical protein